MKSLNIALVDWGMGTAIIVVFAIVCIAIVAVIYSMVRPRKKKDE